MRTITVQKFMRTIPEVQSAEEEMFERTWHERHQTVNLDKVSSKVANGARKKAKEIEEKLDNLGPYSDYDLGMIHGKLSALRWVSGDDWGNLDS